jgi:subtilisin family serine protease
MPVPLKNGKYAQFGGAVMKGCVHFLLIWVGMAILGGTAFCASAIAGVIEPDSELINAWGVQRIGAGLVHASGNRGAGVKVGIIDSGIDSAHPDLAANFAGGWDFIEDDDTPQDGFGHGTFIAGIIGAVDDDQGVVGVAPEASLYAYRVLDSSGAFDRNSWDLVIAALDKAIADEMDVVNMSFGSFADPGQAVLDACLRAEAAGIVIVAAAGNLGTFGGTGDNVIFPGRYSSAMAVAATTMADERAFFSSTGPDLELAAPGFNVYSTLPGIVPGFADYGTLSGTSFASAHVAGAAALLIHDGLPNVRARLSSTAFDLGPQGFDTLFGHGLVDVHAAVIPAPSALGLALLGWLLVHRRRRYKT